MANISNFLACAALILIIPIAICVADQQSAQRSIIRVPRSIGGVFRRLFGRRKQTGFQGTSEAAQPYSYGSYGQASSNYPKYTAPAEYAPSPYGSYGSGDSGYGPAYQPGYGSGYSSYYPGSGASSQYPVPAGSNPYASYASPGSGIDFHQVLDQLVRSAGLSPGGDHEGAASTIQAKGDTPVYSFKKLYSFPFYLTNDDKAAEGYNLHIPFMKKHIRRTAPEFAANSAIAQQAAYNQFIAQLLQPQMSASPAVYQAAKAIQFYKPQNYQQLPASYAPTSYAPTSYAPQSYQPQSYQPQSYQPQSYQTADYQTERSSYQPTDEEPSSTSSQKQ